MAGEARSAEQMTTPGLVLRRVAAVLLGLGFIVLGVIALTGAGMHAFAWNLIDAVDRDGNWVIITPWQAALWAVIFLVIGVDSLRFGVKQLRRALYPATGSRPQ